MVTEGLRSAQDEVGIDVERLEEIQTSMLTLYALPQPSADGGPTDNTQMRESIASFCAAQVGPAAAVPPCAPFPWQSASKVDAT